MTRKKQIITLDMDYSNVLNLGSRDSSDIKPIGLDKNSSFVKVASYGIRLPTRIRTLSK